MAAITGIFSDLITNIGAVVTALFGQSGAFSAILPYFAIGIGCSLVLFAVKSIRSLVWGA